VGAAALRHRSLLGRPNRLPKITIGIRPSTLLRFHRALTQRKYRLLFTPRNRQRPGPKGPSKELIAAICEMKRRNPRFGCPRIAQEIAHAFGVEIDKDVVRRILAQHFRSPSGNDGPSWLTLIGDMKDSLWSVDLFRCESIVLRSYWVMVVMDLFTRRIVGIGVEPAHIVRNAAQDSQIRNLTQQVAELKDLKQELRAALTKLQAKDALVAER
jgi:putative transposase